jgi:hypothetical protein
LFSNWSYFGWFIQCGEMVHRYYMQHVVDNLYKETKKIEKKEDNLKDDFKRRLKNKKKLHHFIKKERMLRKSNKQAYNLKKKRMEED